jgi:hypothetical protein
MCNAEARIIKLLLLVMFQQLMQGYTVQGL